MILIPLTIFGGLFGYPVLQIWATLWMKGKWRLFSLLPIPIMAPVLVVTVEAFLKQSNLWPILLIFVAPLAFAYLLALLLAHIAMNPRTNNNT